METTRNINDVYANGFNGFKIIKSTDGAVTGRFRCFVPQEDSIITHAYQTSLDETLIVNEVHSSLESSNVSSGLFYSAGKGDNRIYYFNSIELTSGSVIAYYI